MVVKAIRSGIRYGFHHLPKSKHEYIKDYDENKEYLYLNYWAGPSEGFKYWAINEKEGHL